MRLPLTCMQCIGQNGHPNMEFSKFEFRDDGRYELICPSGHETTTILQQQKFEVLFEIGANAILDGYYREAVSSFTSSLERFYEFSIRVLMETATGSDTLFQTCWSTVSSQSERQLGAFIFLWASQLEAKPTLLPQAMVTYRNAVIHKGKIPTRDEAIKYGDAVIDVLVPLARVLHERLPDKVRIVTFYHLLGSRTEADASKQVATMSIPAVLERIKNEPCNGKTSLTQQLPEVALQRQTLSSVPNN